MFNKWFAESGIEELPHKLILQNIFGSRLYQPESAPDLPDALHSKRKQITTPPNLPKQLSTVIAQLGHYSMTLCKNKNTNDLT